MNKQPNQPPPKQKPSPKPPPKPPQKPNKNDEEKSKKPASSSSSGSGGGSKTNSRPRVEQFKLPKTVSGLYMFWFPKYNRGLTYSKSERDRLQLRGILPAAIRTLDQQVAIEFANLETLGSDLERYSYLRELQDRDVHLFYTLLHRHTTKMLPLVYTPTVGEACIKYSRLYKRPRGIFLTIGDCAGKFKLAQALGNHPARRIRAIVVTDGERILGLGDQGANGMGIPVGKTALYTALGGIPPEQVLPVTLDVGTNTPTILEDPNYIGARHKRVVGVGYDRFVDEFMKEVARRWGAETLIQFEDFGNANAYRLLEKYRDKYCTFNDDIQGTAAVSTAGVLASLRLTDIKLADNRFFFFGAGSAGLGIADLLVVAMMAKEGGGLSRADAIARITLMDSGGLVTRNRSFKDAHKMIYAKELKDSKELLDAVDLVRPTVLIGTSTCGGAFSEAVLKTMATLNARPVIFALSNPTANAECTAEAAYRTTEGRAIFASGSPFAPVTLADGKTLHPGQGNNVYIFPGLALAVVQCRVLKVPEEVFLVAAKALSTMVTDAELATGLLYPPVERLRECALKVATGIAEWFWAQKLAREPEPTDKEGFLRTRMYDPTNGF